MGCIYQVKNKQSGRSYIGKTERALADRREGHEREAGKNPTLLFHRALKKYGFDCFEWIELIEEDCPNKLNELESYYIKKLGTKMPGGYNLTEGGEGIKGWKHYEETKRKIGEGNRGKVRTDECKKKISESVKGFKHTQETKAKMSVVRKGRPGTPCSEATKEKIKESLIGYKHTEEAKANMVRHLTGRPCSEETREKLRASNLGLKRTKEAKAKMSAAKKGKPSTFQGKHHSEETKTKIRETMKRNRLQAACLTKE